MYRSLIIFAVIVLSGCSRTLPPCPDQSLETEVRSAGCIVIRQNQLLVMEGMDNTISIPGGSGEANETPRCSAHRETWEETGLNVEPDQLVRKFDNGFHLYHCKLTPESGEIDPPFVLEVNRAFWLSPENFDQHEWRFPEQKQWLRNYLQNNMQNNHD
ncbi:NUDIX hydrolase [Amphritea sp. HPY]|uniref:NUDIX hydrolase n=1 Tax=Amphritea sp. HPY TaxID=3421652 RepID=UPI003D7D034E